jgi:hypothetical protein
MSLRCADNANDRKHENEEIDELEKREKRPDRERYHPRGDLAYHEQKALLDVELHERIFFCDQVGDKDKRTDIGEDRHERIFLGAVLTCLTVSGGIVMCCVHTKIQNAHANKHLYSII